MGDQALGQGFDVGVGDGKGEQQFQQFVVLQGPGPAQEKALPQSGPVAVIVGFFRFCSHASFFYSGDGLIATVKRLRADSQVGPDKWFNRLKKAGPTWPRLGLVKGSGKGITSPSP